VGTPGSLYQYEEFGSPPQTAATIIFICPFGTSIERVRFAIRRLGRMGYRVVAYETSSAVFMDADPAILPELISAVREDIKARIAKLKSQGVTDFGLFGSSLGSFILYNCIGREVPELRWGVFNTGGDIAQGVWRIAALQQRHVARGWTLPRLEQAWAKVQWPDFGRLDGCRFVFVSSRRDKVAPLGDIPPYLEPMRRAGADVSVYEVPAIGHTTTVIAGLVVGPHLIRRVRPEGQAG
jgi:pimeloyl-ACP methyl ester carboxylesterase